MKKFLTIFYILLASVVVSHSQGVSYFTQGTVYEALSYAGAQEKLLLVEFSAPWNYRSKWMNQMMNGSEKVTKKLGSEFIVFQIDTQTKEGAGMATVYSLTDYPYLLVFNQNGDVIDRITKTMDAEDFITHLEDVIYNTDGAATWRIKQLATAAENNRTEEIQKLFEALVYRFDEKLPTRQFWEVFKNSSLNYYGSQVFDYFLKNIEKFNENIDPQEIETVYETAIKNELFEYLVSDKTYDSLEFQKLESLAKSPAAKSFIQLIKAKEQNNINDFLITFKALRDQIPEEDGFKLTLALDPLTQSANKEQRTLIRRLIDQQLTQTKIESQREVLEAMRNRF